MIPTPRTAFQQWPASQRCRRRSSAAWSEKRWSSRCELMHASKAFHSMVCNRFEVICHEDLDTLAAPHVFPFVATSLSASRDRHAKSIGEVRLMVGNAMRMMARAPKSRADCHLGAAIGLRSSLENFVPTIPDWALDQHTARRPQAGSRSRPLPRARCQADPAADR